MSNFSTELVLRDEIARLQQLVLEKDALLVERQQMVSYERPQAIKRHTEGSIIQDLVIPQFVGASEYCFLAGVSRGWRVQQLKLSFAAAAAKKRRTSDKLRTCYRAALASAARLQWASDSGLDRAVFDALTALQLVNLVQKVAEDANAQAGVLSWMREHGNRWSESICVEAARAGDLRTLIWARGQNCTWWLGQVLNNAAKRGRLNVLQWLHSNSERRWTKAEQARMLYNAGFCSDLAAAKWLQANGAAWPDSFYTDTAVWPVATVRWALANGCGWGRWDCRDAAAVYCDVNGVEQRANPLYDWAHRHGCPCTCADYFSDVPEYDDGWSTGSDGGDSSVSSSTYSTYSSP
jgi:hypothetical protein